MLKIEFSGSYADLAVMLSSLPDAITKNLSASLTLTGVAETLEDRAKRAALKFPDQKIQAIKAVRELTGWGLAESKVFVERLPGFEPARY